MNPFEAISRDEPLSKSETIFIGLVRELAIGSYVGRASQLTDEELRSLFAVAQAAIRESGRRDVIHKMRTQGSGSPDAIESFPADQKSINSSEHPTLKDSSHTQS